MESKIEKLIEKQEKTFRGLLKENMSELQKNDLPSHLAIVGLLDTGFAALFATTKNPEEALDLVNQMLTQCKGRYTKLQNSIRELNSELDSKLDSELDDADAMPTGWSSQSMKWN